MKWGALPVCTNTQSKAMKAAQRCGLDAYLVGLDLEGLPPMLVVAETHKGAAAVAINQHHERTGEWLTARACDRIVHRKGWGNEETG